MTEEVAHPL